MNSPEKGAFEAAFERWTDPIVNVSDFIWGGSWQGEELLPFPPMVIVLFGIGIYMMIGLRFYPLRNLVSAFNLLPTCRQAIGHLTAVLAEREKDEPGHKSQAAHSP